MTGKGTDELLSTRLSHLHEVMAGHIQRGTVPGLVTLIRQGNEIHVDALGVMTLDGSARMKRDTIFRIASMTKPIVAAATMLLIEDGVLRLDEPVDELLPELRERKVLRRPDGPLDDTVPAKRPIRVRDLLTLRMGFGFLMTPHETPIQQAASERQVWPGPPSPQHRPAPDEWMRRFGTLPLMHQPGERVMYPTSFSVLGVLLSRASGQPLETLLRERLSEPLGMHDTGFSVPAANLGRLASSYDSDAKASALTLYDGGGDSGRDSQWSRPPIFPDGDGGLVSTVDDVLAFGHMLLSKGKHGGTRILSEASVEAMITNHIKPEQKMGSEYLLGDNRGWGFGVSMISQRSEDEPGLGRFGWEGGLGTSWYSDPTENMTAILMTQVMNFPGGIHHDFWSSVYQGIDA